MRQEELREGIKRAFAITALMASLSLLTITEPAYGTECCGCCFDNCGNFEFVPAGQTTEHYWTIGFSYSDDCGRWNVWYRWEHKCYKYNQWMICQRECYCCVTKKWEATGSPTRHLVQQISMCSSPWIIEIRTLPDGEIPPLCEDGDCPCGNICDDGNPCTDDSCPNGNCIHTSKICDDGNPCTDDSCDPIRGCQHQALHGTPCDDGDACTEGDACSNGICQSGTQKKCDDGDPCTDDSCSNGDCIFTHNGNCGGGGDPCSGCNDGNSCNGEEICDPVYGCLPGTPMACNDGNSCTEDSCSNSQCAYTPITCEGGKECVGGTCVCPSGQTECIEMGGMGMCYDLGSSLMHCGACGNACPEGQKCSAGRCVSICESGLQEWCDGRCVYTHMDSNNCGECGKVCPSGTSCENGQCVECTIGTVKCGDKCANLMSDNKNCGECSKVCSDGDPCTYDFCIEGN